MAEKVFNNQDTPEERQTRGLAKILLANSLEGPAWNQELKRLTEQRGLRDSKTSPKGWNSLQKDQCAYCKERGHWKNECPKREAREQPKVLQMEGLDD